MQPPVNLKGFYTSQKKGDKLFQEGIFTIFNEIEEIHVELDTMLKPNGAKLSKLEALTISSSVSYHSLRVRTKCYHVRGQP